MPRTRPAPIVAAPPEQRAREVAALPPGVFTVAAAREDGVTRRVLRRAVLSTPLRGTRIVGPATWETRVRAALALAPAGSMVSHHTAARLHRFPRPSPITDTDPIHVMRPTATSRQRRAGVVDHAGAEHRRRVAIGGLPLTHPADTWADLAGHLDIPELVAVTDVLHARGLRPRLADALEDAATRRRPHLDGLRTALDLADPAAASPMESIARAHLVLAGLPRPQVDADVFDRDGGWLATVDLLWPEHRVVAEFQGREFHLGVRRDADEIRRHALIDAGYATVFLTAAMFGTPAARARTVDHLAHRLGLDPATLTLG